MPGLEDWLNNPLDIVQNIFEQNGSQFSERVVEYFEKKLETKKALSWIPSLNDTPLHSLKASTLVRYRCMVQDMFGPEFYLGVYEVADLKTGQTQLKNGKYRDIAQCNTNQELKLESERNVTMDRQTLYCVPIPGEAEWVKKAYAESSQVKSSPSMSRPGARSKRGRDDDADQIPQASHPENGAQVSQANNTDAMETETPSESADSKRTKTDQPSGPVNAVVTHLNFPLEGETGTPCLVKVYDGSDIFKVNDTVEFVGILSVDPALAQFEETNGEESSIADPVIEVQAEEKLAHAPPPSLVPRLHVILAHPVFCNNPLLPTLQDDNKHVLEELEANVKELRSRLLSVLQHSLLGDSLAAEYMLCYLLASVYAWADVMPLGKFSVNLSGCVKELSRLPALFYHLVSNLVTKSHLLSMTLAKMNEANFSPEKDYKADRLKSGLLQLSNQTHLVIDETVLQAGQLDTKGVNNVTALGNLISWQKVAYDFSFHRQEFPANVPVFTISEGKSLLPSDCHVPLSPSTSPDDLRTYYTGLDGQLTPYNLDKLRMYISMVKQMDYNMADDIQKRIQDDFVEIRKDDSKNMTVDDLHSLLSLVRLLSLSFGLKSATMEMWNKAKAMEVMRKQRVADLLASTAPQRAS